MGIIEKMRLDGRSIFVTGGARGIGKSVATAFAEAGADLAIVDVDIKEAKFNWWGIDYYEEPLVKSYNDVAGYFVIYNFKTSSSGEIASDEMASEMSSLYADKEDLDRQIREMFE